MKSGIYKITNLVNGKVYVGSANHFKRRWNMHTYQLKNQKHSNIHLQRAWDIYKENNFKFEVIEYCNQEDLIEKEQFWIDFLNVTNYNLGYNICRKAGSTLGFKMSEETKKKMSIAKQIPKSEVWKASRKNYIYTEEHKKRMSLANKGTKPTQYTMQRLIEVCSKPILVFRYNVFVGEFSSSAEAARKLQIDRTSIFKVLKGTRSHYKNYTFKRK